MNGRRTRAGAVGLLRERGRLDGETDCAIAMVRRKTAGVGLERLEES